jgi:hypothetical protein
LFVQRPGPAVLRYLELAERVAPRAVHVPEAVWLKANCLLASDRCEQALAEFQRIRVDFTESEFFTKAAEKIRLCESRLPTTQAAPHPGRPGPGPTATDRPGKPGG